MQATMSTPQLLLIASTLFLATSVPCSLSAIIRADSDLGDQQIDNDVNALTSSDNDQHDYWRRRLATLLQATPRHLQPVRLQGSDQDTLDYLVPRLAAKYGGGPDDASWVGVRDPRLYVLSEMAPEDDEDNRLLADTSLYNGKFQKRNGVGRNGPSLSIVQPLDVLRQRMLLEIARRKVLEQVKQVEANREYLKSVGKRDVTAQKTPSDEQQLLQQRHTSRDASAQAQIRNQLSYDESSL